jgi:predicted HTH transcriptional regulator
MTSAFRLRTFARRSLVWCYRSANNRNLADVMKNTGIIQRFGFGLQWARDAMKENGNPPLEFYADNGFVRYVLRKRG